MTNSQRGNKGEGSTGLAPTFDQIVKEKKFDVERRRTGNHVHALLSYLPDVMRWRRNFVQVKLVRVVSVVLLSFRFGLPSFSSALFSSRGLSSLPGLFLILILILILCCCRAMLVLMPALTSGKKLIRFCVFRSFEERCDRRKLPWLRVSPQRATKPRTAFAERHPLATRRSFVHSFKWFAIVPFLHTESRCGVSPLLLLETNKVDLGCSLFLSCVCPTLLSHVHWRLGREGPLAVPSRGLVDSTTGKRENNERNKNNKNNKNSKSKAIKPKTRTNHAKLTIDRYPSRKKGTQTQTQTQTTKEYDRVPPFSTYSHQKRKQSQQQQQQQQS